MKDQTQGRKETVRLCNALGLSCAFWLFLIGLAGLSGVGWVVFHADRHLRMEMLGQARTVTGALNMDDVKALSGTITDLQLPAYQRLRDQLTSVRSIHPDYHFIYLMGQRTDGSIFFFLDVQDEAKEGTPAAWPGDPYEDASDELIQLFTRPEPMVEGPVTDRWGTWISALVPLIDPGTGANPVLFGMDVEASEWRWKIASRAALPAGVIIVLCAGLVILVLLRRPVDVSPRPVLHRLFYPLTAVMTLFVAGGYGLLLYSNDKELSNASIAVQQVALSDFQQAIVEQTRALEVIHGFLMRDEALMNALRSGDREQLLEQSVPLYERLREQYGITHLSFSGPDRLCLVRAHAPDRFGDRLERYATMEAERTRGIASAMDYGVECTLALRVVCPVFEQGGLTGYIELGKPIDSIMAGLGSHERFKLFLFIHKDQVNRTSWEHAMMEAGLLADWNQFAGHVLAYCAMNFPPGAEKFVNCTAHDHGHAADEILYDGRNWRLIVTPFNDVSGGHLGELVLLHDVTGLKNAHRRILLVGGAGAVLALGLGVALMLTLLRRTDDGILAQQAELRASEARYRAYMDNAPLGVFIVNRDGRYLEVNEEAVRITGYAREELLTMRTMDLVDPESADEARLHFAELLARGRATRIIAGHRKDGVRRWWNVVAAKITDDLFLGFHEDITDRREAANVLMERESFIRAVMDNLPIGISVNTIESSVEFEYMNDRFVSIYRTTREALARPDSFWAAVYEDPVFREQIKQRVLADFANGDPARLHWEAVPITRRGQPTTYVDARVVVIPGRNVIVSMVQDVTGREQAKHREKEHAALENQLQQAHRMESIGRLAGGVAHDFNNMLQVIIGHADMAVRHVPDGEPLQEDLKEILASARHSAELTRQLLAFARRQPASPRELEVNGAVAGMLKILRRLVGQSVQLVWRPGTESFNIRMDPVQFDQVLANLCVNARDAINGEGTVIIETERVCIDDVFAATHPGAIRGDYVLLAVSDTGCGMDKATREHIFEPFFTTKELGRGAGLGLATVHGVIMQNRGFVHVYSELDCGSIFRVYLPLLPGKGPHSPVARRVASGHETILLVEDEENVRLITARLLEDDGYRVFAAADAGEAITVAENHPGSIDLLLTDIKLPGMDGIELATKVAGLYPGMKIAYMSGYTSHFMAKQGLLRDGMVFLPKPFDEMKLAQKVREALGDLQS